MINTKLLYNSILKKYDIEEKEESMHKLLLIRKRR